MITAMEFLWEMMKEVNMKFFSTSQVSHNILILLL